MYKILGSILFFVLLFIYIKRKLNRLSVKTSPISQKIEGKETIKSEVKLDNQQKVPEFASNQDLIILAEIEGHLQLADDHSSFGFYEKAKDELLKAWQLDPQNLQVQIALGDLMTKIAGLGIEDGEIALDEAIDWYRKTVAQQPMDDALWYKLALVLERRLKYSEALEAYQKSLLLGDSPIHVKGAIKRLERILKYDE